MPDDAIPYADELVDEPITDDLPSITAEDIAHTVERLEVGRASDTYTLGLADLHVLMHLTPQEWQIVKRTPSALARILAPAAHA
jgi:hypothetical protein